jgi:hypothetical protein
MDAVMPMESLARRLLTTIAPSDASEDIAAATAAVSDALARRFSELVGAVGSCALLERSVVLTQRKLPWLTSEETASHEPPWARVRAAIAGQERELASHAFVLLFQSFVALLGRMIGDVLVRNYLRDQWPDVFAKKEST